MKYPWLHAIDGQSRDPGLTRRTLLHRAGGAGFGALAAGGFAQMLSACGDSDDGDPARDGDLGTFTLQLNWIPSSSWGAEYIADDRGLFRKVGFRGGLKLLHGGPNVAVEPIIASGKANMGICLSETFAAAVMKDAPLVAVGAHLQRNPFCVASLPDNPITSPEDLVGKRIGIQPIAEPLWDAFVKIADVDPESVEKVVVQFDPSPLPSGEVDGFLSFVNNAPVALRFSGLRPVVMMLDDFGFTLYQHLFVVTREELEQHRGRALAGLKVELAARQLLARTPQVGVDLALEKYAKTIQEKPAFAKQSLLEELELVITPEARAKGVGQLDSAKVAANVRTLALAGLKISESDYSTELLDEIYANGPTIRV